MKQGTIVAVCTSPNPGFPKHPREHVTVDYFGLRGDFHCREKRKSFKDPTIEKFNDRQITIVSKEHLDLLARELGKDFSPGSLAENITTLGLGDLAEVEPGTLIRINCEIILKVTEQNEPCKKLLVYHNQQAFDLCLHRRGLLCTVEQGIDYVIRAGYSIQIL